MRHVHPAGRLPGFQIPVARVPDQRPQLICREYRAKQFHTSEDAFRSTGNILSGLWKLTLTAFRLNQTAV